MKAGEGGVAKENEEDGMEWGKGLVQGQKALTEAETLESMKTAPFARYADDKDMNDELKARERDGDPMLKYLQKQNSSSSGGGGGNKKGGGRRPRCKYNAPPNRFGIAPGYRWDGVRRSNGFEAKLLRQGKEREAKDEAAYKWSVEDM